MAFTRTALISFVLSTTAICLALKAPQQMPEHGADFTISRLPMLGSAAQPLTPLEVTDHVVSLKRGNSKSLSSIYVHALRRQARMEFMGADGRLSNGTAQLLSVEAGQVFLAPITVGGQNFDVVVDTGSSDPWLVTGNYACVDPYTGAVQQSQADCYFGPAYNSTSSSTFTNITNQNFNITYSDRETLTGGMGYESFTLGGITVPQQKFAYVNYAAWYGDGYSSGLVGFAYSTLTSAYSGINPHNDQRGGTQMYNTLFTNMYNLSLTAPIFSLAIDRDPNNGGVLALGGIPNIPHSPQWVSASIQSVGVFVGTTTPAYEFYTIQSDGFAVSASPATQFNPFYGTTSPHKTNLIANGSVIVDSGTSLVYAPNSVADAVAAAFRPPATYDMNTDAYFVSCSAIPPVFGVSIAHKILFVNGADLIVPSSQGQCISGVQPNNGGLTILGDVWMKNVLSVFDIGAEKMRFAARQYYGLTGVSRTATT